MSTLGGDGGVGPWRLLLSCCGYDDGSWCCPTWDEADALRESYVAAEGHDRSAILTLDAQGGNRMTAQVLVDVADLEALRVWRQSKTQLAMTLADDMDELHDAWHDLRVVVAKRLRQDWWIFAVIWLVTLLALLYTEVMP